MTYPLQASETTRVLAGHWLGSGRYGVWIDPAQPCWQCERAAHIGVIRMVGRHNVWECYHCDAARMLVVSTEGSC